ncbi:MAG: hypothetical protein ACYC2E_17550 [Sulfuricella sp.]
MATQYVKLRYVQTARHDLANIKGVEPCSIRLFSYGRGEQIEKPQCVAGGSVTLYAMLLR